MSPLFLALLAVIVVGSIVIWLIPESALKPTIVKVFIAIVIVLLIAWVLQFSGVWHPPGKV